MQLVHLKPVDGEAIPVPMDIALQSELLAQMLKDTSSSGKGDEQVVPIQVSTPDLILIIQWCEHHKGSRPLRINVDPQTREREWLKLSDWEKTFFSSQIPSLTSLSTLLNSAHYLSLNSLFVCGCQHLAGLIKGKSLEQIRDMFGEEDDLSQEEKGAIKKEGVWKEF